MSEHGDYYQDDDESHVRPTRERRNSHNEDSGSNSSFRCKLTIIKILLLTCLLKQHPAKNIQNQVPRNWHLLARK